MSEPTPGRVCDKALAARVETVVAERTNRARQGVRVTELTPLVGGACQDNLRVVLQFDDAPDAVMVIRSDAQRSLPGSLTRRDEFPIIHAAVQHGVRTPAVYWLCHGLVNDGRSAYFLDWVDGATIARRVLRSPVLTNARVMLPDQLAAELVRIHAITPASITDPAVFDAIGDGQTPHVERALARHRQSLDQLPEPHPAIELALRWLDANRPPARAPVLCHGDFRTGNIAVTETGLSAVLDWEFAHWGDPMDDLGWACVRDWRFGNLDKPAFGLTDRDALYRAYEAAGGVAVDDRAVDYWEIMGNVRWAIGALYQGQRYRSGAESDIELIAIGKRALEIEYEIVRLLDA